MKVLITVPHGACFTREFRDCDTRAFEAAKMLEKILKKANVNVLVVANTNIPRSQVDMNRLISRSTQWRQTLTKILRTQSFDYIIDMHSFPNGSPWGKRRDLNLELLYDAAQFPRWLSELVKKLGSFASLDVGVTNDIMDEVLSRRSNIKRNRVFLLEVNENHDVLLERHLSTYMHILANFMLNST